MEKRKKSRKYDGRKYGWLMDTKKFILLFIIVLLIFRLVIGFSFVKGGSMEETLYDGEVVLYTRINPEYKKGDVISVRIPSGEYYVKRIIATEGDTIDIRDGKVYINDKIIEEHYIKGKTYPQEGRVRYPLKLEENQIFVMGDNRTTSIDSRSFGVIGTRQIKGKIWFHMGMFYIKSLQ